MGGKDAAFFDLSNCARWAGADYAESVNLDICGLFVLKMPR